MEVRSEQTGDIRSIRKVNLDAFETDAEANLVDALRNSGIDLISLVAEENGDIIGHILFSPVTIDDFPEIKIMGLGPMAVVPEWQRKGIGAKLVNKGLRTCQESGYKAVVVLGHPEYYPRFDFKPSVEFGIYSEYDVPKEVFMVKELRQGALDKVTGTVKYHEAFDEH